MQSRELIHANLQRSREHALRRIDDMRPHATVAATVRGGPHTLWVLGHLAYIERLVTHAFLHGEPNPLAAWEAAFDGDDVSADPADYPSFDDALSAFVAARDATLELVDSLTEADLDRAAARTPPGFEAEFGTWRSCLQYLADHTYMHRGQLADARRSAGMPRMWV